MKITWLGHSGFRIETGDTVLLIDPWLDGNPAFPADRRAEATRGATHILVSHGHGDHASSALAIAHETGAAIYCIHELSVAWGAEEGISVTGFGKGGTVALGDARVTMVTAAHSSSLDASGLGVAGSEAGFMIAAEGHVIYFTGDTDIMADMEWMADYHRPDIWLPSVGGHYTMDMDRAAYAAKRWFDFKLVIPCHWGTFPILAQSCQPLIDALPGIDVRTPEVLKPIEV